MNSTISGLVAAPASAKSLNRAGKLPVIKFPASRRHAERAIPRVSSPRPKKSSANSDGARSFKTSTPSSRAPGVGTRSFRTVTAINIQKNTREDTLRGCFELQKSTNASLGLCRRSRGRGLLVIRHRLLQRDFANDHPVAFFHVGVLHRHVRAQVFPVNRRPFGINQA